MFNLKKIPKIYALLILTFIISRDYYYKKGITFDISPLNYFWQYIDPPLLKNNLFESLLYLHSQPPGFNLFLGLILKIFNGDELRAFEYIYYFMGLVLYISLFELMKFFNLSNKLSYILSTIFILSPSCICYENWLFYSHINITLITLSALLLSKYLKTKQILNLFFFFTTLLFLYLTKAGFDLILLLSFILLIICLPLKRKDIIKAAILPISGILLVLIKNLLIFGSLFSSSWFGLILADQVLYKVPNELLFKLEGEHKINKISLALRYPFRAADQFPQEYLYIDPRFKEIEVLNKVYKSSGAINLNHYGFLKISKDYYTDVKYLFIHHTSDVFKALNETLNISLSLYTSSSSDFYFISSNINKIKKIDDFYNNYFFYKRLSSDGTHYKYVLLKYILLFSILYSLFKVTKADFDFNQKCVLVYILAVIIYISLISTTLVHAENNRYRYDIDGLYMILFSLFFKKEILKFLRIVLFQK